MGKMEKFAFTLLVVTMVRGNTMSTASVIPSPIDPGSPEGPSCVWKLPSKINDEFSVSCIIPAPATVSMHRRLCVKPHDLQPESSKNLSTSERKLENVIEYKANGTYDPSQVGLYLLMIVADGVQSPFPQIILPVVRIEANRQQRRTKDLVTCIVEGAFVQGNLSLLVDGRSVLTVPADPAGYYRSADGRKRAMVIRTNDTVTFRLEVATSRAEKRYSCRFLVPSCVVPAVSEPLTLSSKEVKIEPHYVIDGDPNLQIARLCCHYSGPHPENVIWGRSKDCTIFESVTQYVRNGYDGYILGQNEFISKMDLRPRWDSQTKYNTTYCLSAITDYGLRLPPGDYQCVVKNEYGVMYENSITIPGHIAISLLTEGPRVRINCRFHHRLWGRLDIERMPDGVVVYTLLLADGLGPESDPSAKISLNGSSVSVEVTLEYVLTPGSSFRCRISDKCEVRSSKILAGYPALPQQIAAEAEKTRPRPPHPSTIAPGHTEKKSQTATEKQKGFDTETIVQLRKWTYVSSTVATLFMMVVFIVIRFH
nr:membrane protein m138 [Murid betaherpesvirus 2]